MERRATIQGKAIRAISICNPRLPLIPRFITLAIFIYRVLKMTTNKLLAGIALALATNSVLAESIPEIVVTTKSNQELNDVLATSHILTAEDIEAAQARDIPDLLDQITGISVRDSGGLGSATSVFVRGTSNSQIIVLIDGVRVGSATLGAAALNSYPVESIERVEVVKGPLSGIYGADAVGGVIQLFTKKGGESIGSVSATIGSDSLQKYSLTLNGGNDKHSFHIGAFSEDTDGIDRTSIITGGNEDEDGYEQTALNIGARTTLSDNTVANLSILYTDSTAEFDNTFGSDSGLMTDSETLSSALNITTQFNELLRWTTTLGLNEDESVTNGDFPSTFTTERDNLATELSMGLSDNTQLIVGLDYYEENIKSSTDFATDERDNKGAFALLESTLGAFGVVGNLRYDDNSAYGSDTNGSIAVNFDFNDNLRVVASYGSAFVAPSFNFLYFPFFGNPDLKPEESDSFELSLLGNNASLDWRVSAYKTDIENLHSFDPATFLAANVGEAEIQGIEFEVNTKVIDWDLGINLDLLSAEDKDTGTELDDRAERTLAISASRSFGKVDLLLNLKAESDRYDNRGTELDSFELFDVSAVYNVNDKLKFLANIDNVFDEDYTVNLIGSSERYNTLGRKAKLSVKYSF
jgi:vitamin B12 transporter